MISDAELKRLDDLVAEKWMGWERTEGWENDDGEEGWWDPSLPEPDRFRTIRYDWSPTRNAQQAAEARAKADDIELDCNEDRAVCWVCYGEVAARARCDVSETDGDRVLAENVATCRAIEAALQAKEEGHAEADR